MEKVPNCTIVPGCVEVARSPKYTEPSYTKPFFSEM